MTDSGYAGAILEHYRKQALEFGPDPGSTMLDQTTRELEVGAILSALTSLPASSDPLTVLEIGCGNGYLLQAIRRRFPRFQLIGLDFSPDMIRVAQERQIDNCAVVQGDVRSLQFESGQTDVVVSERCVINLLDRDAQDDAMREIHRVLKPGGHLLLIEAFTDGLENLNRARTELGLPENPVPHHNLWLDKQHIASVLGPMFEQLNSDEPGHGPWAPTNLVSSHYFVSRVLYPAVTQREVLYNTEFVRFFRFLPPMGNYSPIQFLVLRKRDEV